MEALFPEPGDLILVEKSHWYALQDGEYLRVCEHAGWTVSGRDIFVAPRKQVSSFWGPSYGPPSPESNDYLSTSGGPFKTITLSKVPRLERVGRKCDSFWHWMDRPRAGGGVAYQREISVWKLSELADEATWLEYEAVNPNRKEEP